MILTHPFQKLCIVNSRSESTSFILAASGPEISLFSIESGQLLSKYPHQHEQPDKFEPDTLSDSEDGAPRPNKRRKKDAADKNSVTRNDSEESVEIVAERQKGQRRKPKVIDSKLPNISHLIAKRDSPDVVVVTAEDKSINVLEIVSGTQIRLRSKRKMPKRLCAVVLTPDEHTILAGDKFGDVYALPFHPSKEYISRNMDLERPNEVYKPSATEFTVHTKGNLEALRQQLQRQEVRAPRDIPDFDHKLLLGHVSLLTSVAIVEISECSVRKQYILSADRDEHIRVSRGISQAYIIENYCSGHHEFVSALVVLPWAPEFLVAGNGEPSLKVYKWQTGEIVCDEAIASTIKQDLEPLLEATNGERNINTLAVSGIWPFQASGALVMSSEQIPNQFLLISLEGSSVLSSYIVTENGCLYPHQALILSGNVLDVVVIPNKNQILVSVDTSHLPGSMKALRSADASKSEFFESFELATCETSILGQSSSKPQIPTRMDIEWRCSSFAAQFNTSAMQDISAFEISEEPSPQQQSSKGIYSTLGEFLYGRENLRKKRVHTGIEEDLEDVEGNGVDNNDVAKSENV